MRKTYNPYIQDDGRKIFVQSYCVYFDILGFSDEIQNIKTNGLNFFNKYLNVLNKIIEHITENNNFGDDNKNKRFELKIFTDNFVIGFPIQDDGETEFGEIFDLLSYIQLEFIKNDIFIKGAISYSNLYMDNNIVIGQALIDAYQLEEKSAIFPRVILSKEVSEKMLVHIDYYANKKISPQNKRLLIDKDGFYFINYLNYFLDFFVDGEGEEVYSYIEIELIKHKNIVINKINSYSDNFRVYEKYIWIANYHNYFCENFLNPDNYNLQNLLIDKKHFKTISTL